MNPLSVRPLLEMEDETFRNMLKPFDPTQEGEDRCVEDQQETDIVPGEDQAAEEEATQPKTRAPPVKPSREEVEQHMTTHLPFRSWCPHCVRGKSGSKPHRINQGMHEMPTMAVDYMFMHSYQSEQEEKKRACQSW